jgi:hypothetical protein
MCNVPSMAVFCKESTECFTSIIIVVVVVVVVIIIIIIIY